MNSEELARLVAAEVSPEVAAETEREIKGEPSPEGGTRAFGAAEALATAGFLVSCAQFALEVWRARQDRAFLMQALAEGLEKEPKLDARLDPEKRLGLMARIVNRIVPERFGSSPSLPAAKERTKQHWLAEWMSSSDNSDKTRSMSTPVLMPFAGMDYFALYKPIHWTPPAGVSAGLPASVSVPQGFVTDLATVPPYFWWVVTPSGRHGHAAILHDWLYWEQGVPRAAADRVFETVMAELDVALPVRKAMWAAVRIGGGDYWNEGAAQKRQGRSRVLKRLPDKPVSWEDWRKVPDVFA